MFSTCLVTDRAWRAAQKSAPRTFASECAGSGTGRSPPTRQKHPHSRSESLREPSTRRLSLVVPCKQPAVSCLAADSSGKETKKERKEKESENTHTYTKHRKNTEKSRQLFFLSLFLLEKKITTTVHQTAMLRSAKVYMTTIDSSSWSSWASPASK